MIRVAGIKISIDQEKEEIVKIILKKLKIKEQDLLSWKIFKQSIDARKKNNIYFVYTIDIKVKNEEKFLKKIKDNNVSKAPKMRYDYVSTGSEKLLQRPVIIGTGPAGLFAGLILSQMGYEPILLERGADVETRTRVVKKFWDEGKLDTKCNVQFGEGGAGTFSDGKLTTGINDKRCRKALEEFIRFGAPEDILYVSKAHVGTDKLKNIVKSIRQEIIKLGGQVRFNSTVTDLIVEKGKVTSVVINNEETLDTETVVLAVGHSARDTFEMLYDKEIHIIQKSFSIGVRIEHPQPLINQSQYGQFANHKHLGAADYKLSHHFSNGRSAYTFCMCPGGVVVAAASETGRVVTNGMSEYARDQENANSALLVGVKPEDFGSDHPLAGMEFQRKWESKAFELGGSNYHAPAQQVGDFLDGRPSQSLGNVQPTYKPGITLTDLKGCLPVYVIETMRAAILEFDKKIKGFALPDAVMTGVETRSSSPVRIVRNENYESSIVGIYPAGEGAGYAGGIMSAAVDGIRIAEQIAMKYRPLK